MLASPGPFPAIGPATVFRPLFSNCFIAHSLDDMLRSESIAFRTSLSEGSFGFFSFAFVETFGAVYGLLYTGPPVRNSRSISKISSFFQKILVRMVSVLFPTTAAGTLWFLNIFITLATFFSLTASIILSCVSETHTSHGTRSLSLNGTFSRSTSAPQPPPKAISPTTQLNPPPPRSFIPVTRPALFASRQAARTKRFGIGLTPCLAPLFSTAVERSLEAKFTP